VTKRINLGEQKKARMVKERIERRGAKVWLPKNQVTTFSIPQTETKKNRGIRRENER
jgi:hypothetical protein